MAKFLSVLSQHQMLSIICSDLTAADILRLGATCKEAKTYVLDSTAVFDSLKKRAVCDGSGLKLRSMLFKRHEDVCSEDEARPCTDCGVAVCDNCRLHFLYPAQNQELQFGCGCDEQHFELEQCVAVEFGRTKAKNMRNPALRKAFDIFWRARYQRFCQQCRPLMLPGMDRKYRCTCGPAIYEYFIRSLWLCIHCFFKRETEAAKVTTEKVVAYSPSTKTYEQKYVCDCGKLAEHQSIEACRYCHKGIGWYSGREQEILKSIRAQLGYERKQEGPLAELFAQLG